MEYGGHRHAAADQCVRQRSIRLDFFQRVTNDSFDDCGVAKNERQRVLQWVARRTLKTHQILVHVPLRKNFLAEKAVVGQAAAQVIIVPGSFALDPRLRRHVETQTVGFPGGARAR